jgi:multiple sugar transport system substrate-binding protein
MRDFTRRDSLKVGAGLIAGAAVGAKLRPAFAQEPTFDVQPEAGATLRVLRPAKFVAGDEKLWLENTEKFIAETGVQVKVESQGWEDLRPKSAVAANVGKGPDVVYGWYDDAHQYPDKLVDLTDLGEYLGAKYGGWYDVCKKFGQKDGKWISIPLAPPAPASSIASPP